MLGEQNDHVQDVVLGDLVDLQLGQEQIHGTESWIVQLEPPAHVDGMRHDQLIQEDVDLEGAVGPRVDQPLDAPFLAQTDYRIQDPALFGEEALDLALVAQVRHQVYVASGSPAEGLQQVGVDRTVDQYRQ